MAGLQVIENIIGSGLMMILGNSALIGVLVLSFFGGWVLLANTRADVKVLIIFPALILAAAFWPPLLILYALGFMVVVGWAVMKAINH